MNESTIAPTSIDDLHDIVAQYDTVLPVGNQTKRPLSANTDAALVSLRKLSGVIEYEPSEYTVTAWAGTTLQEIASVLAERDQYLPFDPPLVRSGATIGGTVAAGLSGPGRFRFGGVRDFIIGASFQSGDGHEIHSGGKVVKNAAGFDLPKMMVGSLGRLGILTRLTFRVFPKPNATTTLTLRCKDLTDAIARIAAAAGHRWELDAIDYRPSTQTIQLRIAGPAKVNEAIAADIASRWPGEVQPDDDAASFWDSVTDLNFGPIVAKVPVTASNLHQLQDFAATTHISAAANVAWIGIDEDDGVKRLDNLLDQHTMNGLLVTGVVNRSPRIGSRKDTQTFKNLQRAINPAGKFLSL